MFLNSFFFFWIHGHVVFVIGLSQWWCIRSIYVGLHWSFFILNESKSLCAREIYFDFWCLVFSSVGRFVRSECKNVGFSLVWCLVFDSFSVFVDMVIVVYYGSWSVLEESVCWFDLLRCSKSKTRWKKKINGKLRCVDLMSFFGFCGILLYCFVM